MREIVFVGAIFCLLNVAYAYEGASESTYCPHNDCSRAMNIIDTSQAQISVGQCQECSKEYPNRVVHCMSTFTDHYYFNGEIISQDKVDLLAEQNFLQKQANVKEDTSGYLYGWISFIVFVVACVLYSGIVWRCPECHKLWARRMEYREEIDRRNGYKEVARYRDHRDPKGHLIKRESWQETVPAIIVTYREHYKCKNCSHEWTEISETST